MSGYIEFSDGAVGLVDDDGWVDEFDAVDMPALESATPALGAAFIDVDATSVVDTELPERAAFVGPPAPMRMPDGLPTVELMDQFVTAVQEWGKN